MAEKVKAPKINVLGKQKEAKEEITMPAWFARALIAQAIYNPAKSTGAKSSTSYQNYDKESIIQWLQSPETTSNQKSLRDASNYMYIASQHYNRLINYYAGLYTGAYVIAPSSYSSISSINVSSFKKQYVKVAKAVELMDIPSVLRDVLTVVLREGAYYGVWVSDNNSKFLYKVDADYCRITHIIDGTYLYSVDMTKLSGKLEFYPAIFTDLYTEYLNTGEKWQQVPVGMSFCVKADTSMPYVCVPPFAATMPSLYTIANIESLQEQAEELKNYKMISGKVDTDDEGNALISGDMYEEYYEQISNALGEYVGLALTPFKLEGISFPSDSQSSDIDTISRAVSNYWSTAGTSGLLHGVSNETAGVTKLALKNDESYIGGMVKQVEKCINRFLKTEFSNTYKFKITILPVTIFNQDEQADRFKTAASFGLGKSYYAASIGIHQEDIAGLDYLEKQILGFSDLKPMTSAYTTNSGETETGRPSEDDTEIDLAGEETRDNDTNANR